MATKDYAYDHPEYGVTKFVGGRINGNAGGFGFCAFQAMQIKSIQASVITAGTAADTLVSYKISGTTTTTVALHTNTAATGSLGNFTSTFTLAQGDIFNILKGADATAVYALGVEIKVNPFAAVTQ